MSAELDKNTKEAVECLRAMIAKYGGQYVRKYFGFSFKNMASAIGIKESFLSDILKGRKQLPKKREAKFLDIIRYYDVLNKMRDFKETDSDKYWREYRIKNLKKT